MTWILFAIVTPIVLTVYLLITDFCDLFPFNDVSKHTTEVRKWELLNYILPLISVVLSGFFHSKIAYFIALLIALTYLVGNWVSWWHPYLFGCSKERKEILEKHFGRTIKVLPPIQDHPIPNLEHMPVTLLIWVWFMAALVVFLRG